MTAPTSRHDLEAGPGRPADRVSVLGIARRISREHPDRARLDDVRHRLIVSRHRAGYDVTHELRVEQQLRGDLEFWRIVSPIGT